MTDKTATGTIAIQVEDFNDHCPTLSSTSQTLCSNDNMVYATAVDADTYPNAAPFEFEIRSNTKEKWTVEHLNGEYSVVDWTTEYYHLIWNIFLIHERLCN